MDAGNHCFILTLLPFLVLLFAGVVFAGRDLDDGANPFPAAPAAGRQGGPYYGYGGGIPGFPPGGFFGGAGYGGAGGGGWGAGYGGAGGGGVEVPTVTCQEKGPCYGKKVTCPKKCFWSYSRSGNGYGAGGGGGSCTVDCKYKCAASC
ncbi:hypothetical protein QOZ80_5BG0448180 [Eleusine coracana subsp. coracana]|nr:hypothetical protein QOZ80_5BG0448180 [Eleusine coracana subsp. coracana]